MSATRARRLLILVFVILLPSFGRAQITHRLREGENLAALARRYYGAAWKWSYIAGVNGIADPKKVPPGRKLKIPVVWPYTVRRGDRLYTVAERLLGDGKRYPFLARFNGLPEKTVIERGQRLLVPIQIRHRVQRGDTLSKLGRRYYRSARMRFLLRDYNFLKSMRLEPGQTILVPIFDREAALDRVKARISDRRPAAPPKAEAPQPEAPPPTRAARGGAPPRPEGKGRVADPSPERSAVPSAGHEASGDSNGPAGPAPAGAAVNEPGAPHQQLAAAEWERRLGAAEQMLREGEYEDVVEELLDLAESAEGMDGPRRARLHKTLAVALVALGRTGEALDHFRRMLAAEPDATLDPVLTSPKVLRVFQQARESD